MTRPETMRAMVLQRPHEALVERELPVPQPGDDEVLVRVGVRGACRTDLHVVDAELTAPKLPLVLGHEIVGEVVAVGSAVTRHSVGERVGVVVSGGIHMSDIPSFPNADLWEERVIRSVANLTREDGDQLLALAPRIPVHTEVQPFPLAEANAPQAALRDGAVRGAAVLVP